MAKKKSLKEKILQDTDGTWFCSNCGQAGFRDQSVGWGHTAQCKGFKAVRNKVLQKSIEAEKGFTELAASHGLDPQAYFGEGSNVPSPKYQQTGGDVPAPYPLPYPLPSPPTLTPSSSSVKERELVTQLAQMRAQNQILHKFAFNHSQHVGRTQSFSGPSDLLTSGLSDIMQIKWVRYLVGFGALIFVASWIKESADKLSGRVSNKNVGKKK